MRRTPTGIVKSYENLRTIMRRGSPMSQWSNIVDALNELGRNIYGTNGPD